MYLYKFGDKEVLQHAIPQVLQKNLKSKVIKPILFIWDSCIVSTNMSSPVCLQEVLLDLKETHLTCTERSSKVVKYSSLIISLIY